LASRSAVQRAPSIASATGRHRCQRQPVPGPKPRIDQMEWAWKTSFIGCPGRTRPAHVLRPIAEKHRATGRGRSGGPDTSNEQLARHRPGLRPDTAHPRTSNRPQRPSRMPIPVVAAQADRAHLRHTAPSASASTTTQAKSPSWTPPGHGLVVAVCVRREALFDNMEVRDRPSHAVAAAGWSWSSMIGIAGEGGSSSTKSGRLGLPDGPGAVKRGREGIREEPV